MGDSRLMKIDLTEREWRNIKIGLLEAIRQTDKSCKQMKFDDNPLIRELLKLHHKLIYNIIENNNYNHNKKKNKMILKIPLNNSLIIILEI